MSQREKIAALCDDEGLELMVEIADIVTNRGVVTPLDVRRYLEQTGVLATYEAFIGPAIDRLETAIAEEANRHGS